MAEIFKISRCPECGGAIGISRLDIYSAQKVVTALFTCRMCRFKKEIKANYTDTATKSVIDEWNKYTGEHETVKGEIEKAAAVDCVNCRFYDSNSEFCRKHYKSVFPISFCYDGEEREQQQLSPQEKSWRYVKKFVIEAVREQLQTDTATAWDIVDSSFFPELLSEMPEFVQHYDAEYWAKEIIKDRQEQSL